MRDHSNTHRVAKPCLSFIPPSLTFDVWPVRLLVRSTVFQAVQVGFESHTGQSKDFRLLDSKDASRLADFLQPAVSGLSSESGSRC